MIAIFLFLLSAILLTLFVLLKVGELKRGRLFWFSKFLSYQDRWLKRVEESLNNFLETRWIGIKRRIRFLLFVFLPFLVRILAEKVEVFMVESFKKIKDNVRGKYRKFSSVRPKSKYLEEISKIKDNSKDENRSEL